VLRGVGKIDPRSKLVEVAERFYGFLRQEEYMVRIVFGEFHLRGAVHEHAQRLFDRPATPT